MSLDPPFIWFILYLFNCIKKLYFFFFFMHHVSICVTMLASQCFNPMIFLKKCMDFATHEAIKMYILCWLPPKANLCSLFLLTTMQEVAC